MNNTEDNNRRIVSIFEAIGSEPTSAPTQRPAATAAADRPGPFTRHTCARCHKKKYAKYMVPLRTEDLPPELRLPRHGQVWVCRTMAGCGKRY